MAERRGTTPSKEVTADGSAVPARLRIVGWIVLSTALGLLAVVLTIRSALLADVEEQANANVAQEVDEFRTYAERAEDPDTGQPIADANRLLTLYLERQFPGRSEVLLGYDRSIDPAVASPLLVQQVDDAFGLVADTALIQELIDSEATSGTAEENGATLRWGRADVEGGAGGAFLIAEFVGPAEEEVADTVRLIIFVCLGGLLLTAAIAFAVAGQILAPVRTIRRAARRITRADLSERITVRGRDDVAALALTFNAMLDRLQAAFAAHQSFSSSAGRHLRAALDQLDDPARTPAQRAETMTEIRETLYDMDVLALSQSPEFVRPDEVDVARLTDQLAADVAALSTTRTWVVEHRGEGAAQVDAQRVRDAVHSLAVNAVKQPVRGAPAPLRLGTRTTGDSLEVWVSDDGPGLAPELAARVLHRDEDTVLDPERAGGPGLGLAVVRAVADAHSGSAWVETEEGAGATFGITLPLRSARLERVDAP